MSGMSVGSGFLKKNSNKINKQNLVGVEKIGWDENVPESEKVLEIIMWKWN